MLTTIAIDVASVYLRKLHNIGQKLTDVAKMKIWFGGHQVEVREFLTEVCKGLHVSVERLDDLDLDQLVKQRLIDKVHEEEGEHEFVKEEDNNGVSRVRVSSCKM